MAEIWLASAAAFMALGNLLFLVVNAFRNREIEETLEFLVNENERLRNSVEKMNAKNKKDARYIKYAVYNIESQLNK